MKVSGILIPLILALCAAIGNAMVTVGQKNASNFDNPFFFGAFSLLFATIGLFAIALFHKTEQLYAYAVGNFQWFAMTGGGMLVLNIFLYFLYRGHGANSYTLYAILAIITTSIGVSVYYYGEKMNIYYALSLVLAIATVLLFLKGKALDA